MALEMRERMKFMRQIWEDEGISKPLNIRIGINTGYCNVGNFGSEDRLDYTIIGGEVNLASRLESNAPVGQILVSHETYSLIKNSIICEEREEINVKGLAHKVRTYQVIDKKEKNEKGVVKIKDNYEGFSLTVDLEVSRKAEVIASLKNALEKIQKD